MSKSVSDYQVRLLEFQMFCERRGWSVYGFNRNDKNLDQFIGRVSDETGMIQTYLITKKGHYLKYFGKEEGWKEVEYVLKEE